EATDELRGVLEVGKQHRHLFALTFERSAGGQNLFSEIGWGIGKRRTRLCACWDCGGEGQSASVTNPDQDSARFISSQVLGLNEFLPQCLKGLVIQLELDLQCPVRHTLPLTEQVDHGPLQSLEQKVGLRQAGTSQLDV